MARFHVITDAETGETSEVPFTPEEEANADVAEAEAMTAKEKSPQQKLADFLAANPDVLAAIGAMK